ncbi:hypothetical protein QFZ77_002417 [Paenibacillus sp. V4I3]|uniref:hypothetical protein n=1 Tax=Paenibacillus sp. V4I3 TaxID=3042305 RepID=UPI0027840F72|nr:hypothetical protein [Paenibacillus sp. V4I3]MDQ0873758.1 hypothetical protein [Paenibacillus sp. V4I3]
METLQGPLKDVRFDIYERVQIEEVSENIFALTKTELTPHIKMLMRKDEIQLVGYLQLKLSYKDSGRFLMQHEYQHNIPVEIKIPASRVTDAYLLDADIENFNVEVMGSRNVNVTGVLIVYEKETKTMSDKVKLPREVTEAIDKMKYMGVVSIMANMAHWSEEDPTTEELYTIHDYYLKNPYMIAQALVNGYEIEETPEDKVREYYNQQNSICTDRQHSPANAIRNVLNFLEIKIEGVNA